jgi:hypothetical protein
MNPLPAPHCALEPLATPSWAIQGLAPLYQWPITALLRTATRGPKDAVFTAWKSNGPSEPQGAGRVNFSALKCGQAGSLAKVRQWRWQESPGRAAGGHCGTPEKNSLHIFCFLLCQQEEIICAASGEVRVETLCRWKTGVTAKVSSWNYIAKVFLWLLSGHMAWGGEDCNCWNHTPKAISFIETDTLCIPGLHQTRGPPASVSPVLGLTIIYHHTWLKVILIVYIYADFALKNY